MTFDPTSSEYQVSPDFAPDKGETWPYPPEKDGWTLAHNAIRTEMELLKDSVETLLKTDVVEGWMVTGLVSMWKVHFIHIHSHHDTEDVLMAPQLRERFKYPPKVCALTTCCLLSYITLRS
jgi:hypothetical protein